MLYRVQNSDLEAAVNVATRAMRGYPVFTLVIPNDTSGLRGSRASRGYREDKLRHVIRFILGIAAIQGEVVAPSPNIEAVAVWVRSEDMRLATSELLRAGFATLPFKIGLPATQRLLSVGKRKHAERAKVLTGPFTLLDMLSVDPEQQGKGYGRLLLETKLETLDHERARCYLETSDERNVGYYRRFGFDLVHQFEISGVPVYGLLRTPR